MDQKIKKIKKERTQLSKRKITLKQGIAASRAFLGEIASAVGWIMEGGYGGLAEYEDRKAREKTYEARRLSYEQREWLRDLERRKLVKTKRIGEKLMVRLTAQGWQKVLRDKVKYADGKCKNGICFVVFDVPESERHVRDTLRAILSDCGFAMVQKSVWMTCKDVVEPLCALLQGINLQKWVRIVVGNEIRQFLPKRLIIQTRARLKSHAGETSRSRLSRRRAYLRSADAGLRFCGTGKTGGQA